jgi:Fe2+ or Zn2+ uptake regulation protein
MPCENCGACRPNGECGRQRLYVVYRALRKVCYNYGWRSAEEVREALPDDRSAVTLEQVRDDLLFLQMMGVVDAHCRSAGTAALWKPKSPR